MTHFIYIVNCSTVIHQRNKTQPRSGSTLSKRVIKWNISVEQAEGIQYYYYYYYYY